MKPNQPDIERLPIRVAAFVIVFLLSVPAMTRVCTSTGSGNWIHGTTWTCGTAPQAGDTLNILAGHIIHIANNLNYTGAIMHINLHGTIQMSGGGSKISLPCGSYFEIHPGGILHPDPAYNGFSETVKICNITYWNTTMGSQTGYTAWPNAPAPLPVELISFTATQNGTAVDLEWLTATELETDHFLIYRSESGGTRVLVGTQQAAGETMTIQRYMMTDIPPGAGDHYYHLEEATVNGTFNDLAMAVVNYHRTGSLRCGPNPMARTDAVTVELPATRGGGLDVRLVGPSGRWLHPAMVEVDGLLIVVMDGLYLGSGLYTLQVLEGGRPLGTCRLRMD